MGGSSPGNGEDTLASRGEAAALLGFSVSKLRRLEQTELVPIVDAKGVHRHSMGAIVEYKIKHVARDQPATDVDGTLAAAAFEYFDRKLGAADVVKLLRMPPRIARELHREWIDLRGGFFVGAQIATTIEQRGFGSQDWEIRSGEDLLAMLDDIAQSICIACNGRTARFCTRCFEVRPHRAVAAAAKQAATERAAAERWAQRRRERAAASRARCG